MVFVQSKLLRIVGIPSKRNANDEMSAEMLTANSFARNYVDGSYRDFFSVSLF